MRIALEDLKLEHLFLVYPGDAEFVMADRVSALGLAAIPTPRAKFRRTLGLVP